MFNALLNSVIFVHAKNTQLLSKQLRDPLGLQAHTLV